MTPYENKTDIELLDTLEMCIVAKQGGLTWGPGRYALARKELLKRLQDRNMVVDDAILRHAIAAYYWTVQEGALTWSSLADGIKKTCSLDNPANKEIWTACMYQAGREDEL